MARPVTKTELIKAANEQFKKMQELINAMTNEKQNMTFNFSDDFNKSEAHWARDKNLRDVLIHLYEWHQLLLIWVIANRDGQAASFLPEPYTWKTYGEMNVEFWKKHQATLYENAKRMLEDSHENVLTLIEQFSDEELFEKKHFSWTGTTSLGSYCISATASHYDWAIKKIKLHMKTVK